jgi:hypothetical protein
MSKTTRKRLLGWLLISLGMLVAIFSQKIVFPGLERIVGIETIVGKENVVYLPDGGYGYTNPRAMLEWISAVVTVGISTCLVGCWLLLQARKQSQTQDSR